MRWCWRHVATASWRWGRRCVTCRSTDSASSSSGCRCGTLAGSGAAVAEAEHDAPEHAATGAEPRPLQGVRIGRVTSGAERGDLAGGREPRHRDEHDRERDVTERAELEDVPRRIPAEAVSKGEGAENQRGADDPR